MKSYTDLEQSKILKDILPMESADMRYHTISKYNQYPCDEIVYTIYFGSPSSDDIPCWSLAALLEIIRKPTAVDLLIDGRGCRCHCRDKHEGKFYGTDDYCDTPIDACIEVILKLHELKIL